MFEHQILIFSSRIQSEKAPDSGSGSATLRIWIQIIPFYIVLDPSLCTEFQEHVHLSKLFEAFIFQVLNCTTEPSFQPGFSCEDCDKNFANEADRDIHRWVFYKQIFNTEENLLLALPETYVATHAR
jgi:hypothetical protein